MKLFLPSTKQIFLLIYASTGPHVRHNIQLGSAVQIKGQSRNWRISLWEKKSSNNSVPCIPPSQSLFFLLWLLQKSHNDKFVTLALFPWQLAVRAEWQLHSEISGKGENDDLDFPLKPLKKPTRAAAREEKSPRIITQFKDHFTLQLSRDLLFLHCGLFSEYISTALDDSKDCAEDKMGPAVTAVAPDQGCGLASAGAQWTFFYSPETRKNSYEGSDSDQRPMAWKWGRQTDGIYSHRYRWLSTWIWN